MGWLAVQGKQAFDAAKQAAEQFHATMTEGAISAQAEITKLDLLYRAATNVAKPYNERKKRSKDYRKYIPPTSEICPKSKLWSGMLLALTTIYGMQLLKFAQARAAMDDITELQGQK